MSPVFTHHRKVSPYKIKGFSLLEVLVSMLILSVGMLGIAALQLRAMQFTTDAVFRGNASNVAQEIFERMRIMIPTDRSSNLSSWQYTVPQNMSGNCNEATAVTQSSNDISCWQKKLFMALPPGSTASIVASTNNSYKITINWIDRGGGGRSVSYQFIP